MLQAKGMFDKAPLRSQKGLGMGRHTGSPIGGAAGRAFLREWQDSAAAMPQPLSEDSKELLRQSYIYRYANIPIPEPRTRKHASEAVKNIKKKKTGQIKVRRAVCLRTLHSNPPTGCVHEAVSQYVADQAS